MASRYVCKIHGVRVALDHDHRHANIQVASELRPVGQCYLLLEWPQALGAPTAILGDRGPWHPKRGAFCHVEVE